MNNRFADRDQSSTPLQLAAQQLITPSFAGVITGHGMVRSIYSIKRRLQGATQLHMFSNSCYVALSRHTQLHSSEEKLKRVAERVM